ncbi:MAG: acetylxylan esterase [Segetibacter sp.]|nr:acetylxylan esterase [Segetibacter sp.]
MKKLIFLICLSALLHTVAISQTSDDAFREPLKDVLTQIQKQYGIAIRYDEALVKDKWINYAGWKFKLDVEKTLTNVLASVDITFAKEGHKKYKLQNYQYHLKTVEEGKQQLAYLSTLYNNKQSWEKRKAELQSCILTSLRLNNLPARPASKPIITAVRKFDGYTVENIAIETLPGLYVSGSLYRPAKVKGKVPVIINPDGHFSKGRYRDDCQYRCATLARMGALAFSYDLFGWDGESQLQVKSTDHRRALVQTIQALNATRLLDYLLSLKEADATRVAITGASGGGSQTMLMAAIDNRITLSVPVAMTSSYHSGGCPCESGMGIHMCSGGTNNVEIAAMAAPHPQLIVSDGKDWTQNVPQNELPFLQRTYGFYGKTNVIKNAHLATEGHDYGINKRKAMYDFIAQQWKLNPNAADESKVTIEKETALYVFGDKGERLPANAVKGFDEVTKVFEQAVVAK